MNKHVAMMKWCDRGKLKVIQEKSVPAPLYPSQMPHGLASDQTWAFYGEKTMTKILSHGMANVCA
jgi:hypothetical protein